MKDTFYMQKALSLAAKGRGCVSPNPMVGAVVVKNDAIVGQGWHEHVGGPHAEVNAIDAAGSLAKDATLYVSLEPCNHFGRTPPCTAKIIQAGIKRVVAAMADPNPHVKGKGMAFLNQHGIDTHIGVLASEALKLNECFIKYILTGLPFVILKCAATLDGRIATRTGDSKWITNATSRNYVHELRHAVDAILVGIRTVKKDNPSLTTRLLKDRQGRDPIRVILDTRLEIEPHAKVLTQESEALTFIAIGEDTPTDHFKSSRKVRLLPVKLVDDRIHFPSLLQLLGAQGITSLLIEGGSQVIGSALASRIVDKIQFFYAPKILGGCDGIPILSGEGPEKMKDCLKIKQMSVHRFDEDVMIEGYPEYENTLRPTEKIKYPILHP